MPCSCLRRWSFDNLMAGMGGKRPLGASARKMAGTVKSVAYGMDGAGFSLICEWTFGRDEWFATTSIFSTAKPG